MMAFDPSRFPDLGNRLAASDQSEVSLRTAVGRAYYAAFVRARDSLQITGRRHVHGRVIGAVKRVDRAAGDQLDKLEELRGYADYDMDVTHPLFSDWQANWRKARAFATHVLRRLP